MNSDVCFLMNEWGDDIMSKIETSLAAEIPVKNINTNAEVPPWVLVDASMMKLIKEKKMRYRRMILESSNDRTEAYLNVLRRCREMYANKVDSSTQKIISDAKSNTRSLFKMIATNRCVKENIPRAMKFNGIPCSGDRGVERAFEAFFKDNMNGVGTIVLRDDLLSLYMQNVSNECGNLSVL